MIELVIVSRLLEYPDVALWQHQQEMFEALASSEKLSKEDAHALGVFLRDLVAQDPHYSFSPMLMASIRWLLNRLNLVSDPWQPSPKVKPQPFFSGKASSAISRWLVGITKRSS